MSLRLRAALSPPALIPKLRLMYDAGSPAAAPGPQPELPFDLEATAEGYRWIFTWCDSPVPVRAAADTCCEHHTADINIYSL